MYKRDLDRMLSSQTLPSSILLYGEPWFVDHYTGVLLQRLGGEENLLSFYFDEYDYESAKNFISQPSLFGDRNILLIRHDKKLPKKELDTFVELCRKNPTSFFLFAFAGTDQTGKDLSRSFSKKKDADFVRFFKPNLREAVQYLRQRANEIGLEIEPYALQHLLLVQNEDLSLSMNELEKLLLVGRRINAADIDTHVYGMGEISMDRFIRHLLAKEDIREELARLLESGATDEIRIVGALQTYITQLFLFHSYIKVHGRFDAQEILGYPLPPNLAKERAAQAIKLNLATFQRVLEALLEAEYTLKKGVNIDKNSYLFSALIKLQTYL